MLRTTVGLTRKISRDYNSTGYSINLDGEIGTAQDDPKKLLDAIHVLYRLAEDALAREIDRDQGEQAIGRRDEQNPRQETGSANGKGTRQDRPHDQGNGRATNGQDEAASNKQIQFLLSIGKRQNLSKQQIEGEIEKILGQKLDLYQLTKKEASKVIDTLNQPATANGRR